MKMLNSLIFSANGKVIGSDVSGLKDNLCRIIKHRHLIIIELSLHYWHQNHEARWVAQRDSELLNDPVWRPTKIFALSSPFSPISSFWLSHFYGIEHGRKREYAREVIAYDWLAFFSPLLSPFFFPRCLCVCRSRSLSFNHFLPETINEYVKKTPWRKKQFSFPFSFFHIRWMTRNVFQIASLDFSN